MKKFIGILLALVLVFSFVGCASTPEVDNSANEVIAITQETEITMENIDEYLNVDKGRFIDLRNSDDLFKSGYIQGFENVPFFDYLENNALVRNDGWNFSEKDIVEVAVLENVFGAKDTPIVLICAGGTRAGYVKAALDSIGYTNVKNAGGFGDYAGTNKVLGDGEYVQPARIPSLKDVQVDMNNIDEYMDRPNARYVDLRNFEDFFKAGYIQGFEAVPFFDYLEGRALVRNDGWNYSSKDLVNADILINVFGEDFDQEIFLMCAGGTRAGFVKAALEEIGYTKVYNLGGFGDYNGANKVLGDGEYTVPVKK